MAAMCGARAEAQATPDPSTGPASASITDASTRPSTSSGTPMPPQSMDSAVAASAPPSMDPSAAPQIVNTIPVKEQRPQPDPALPLDNRQRTATIEAIVVLATQHAEQVHHTSRTDNVAFRGGKRE